MLIYRLHENQLSLPLKVIRIQFGDVISMGSISFHAIYSFCSVLFDMYTLEYAKNVLTQNMSYKIFSFCFYSSVAPFQVEIYLKLSNPILFIGFWCFSWRRRVCFSLDLQRLVSFLKGHRTRIVNIFLTD